MPESILTRSLSGGDRTGRRGMELLAVARLELVDAVAPVVSAGVASERLADDFAETSGRRLAFGDREGLFGVGGNGSLGVGGGGGLVMPVAPGLSGEPGPSLGVLS